MDDLKSIIGKVATGATLSRDEAASAFDAMMSGEATPSQMGGLLMALRVRGETVEELAGAARIMRAKAVAVEAPPGTIDTCGTGGDASGSFNISTASALVVAGCGVPVAKHGNRALSSQSGSADVLTALGVNIEADLVLKALGFDPEDLPALLEAPDLGVTGWGTLKIDWRSMMTSLQGVFAAGDIVRGASLVVWAVRDGRDAAERIHSYLTAKTQTALAVAAE